MLGLMSTVSMLDSFKALMAWEPVIKVVSTELFVDRRMLTRVIEFTSLTDGETTGTDDQNLFHIWLFKPGQDLARDPPRELGRRVQGRLAVGLVVVTYCRCGDRSSGFRRAEESGRGRR